MILNHGWYHSLDLYMSFKMPVFMITKVMYATANPIRDVSTKTDTTFWKRFPNAKMNHYDLLLETSNTNAIQAR